jgi:hypothetical protein
MMIQKKYGKSLTIATAILSLLFLSHVKVQAADPPKPKPLPGIQMLLLSDNAPQPPPVPQPNIAFVTSVTYVGGTFGDLEAADKACGILAEAARLPHNTYKAWLSTSSVNAIDRLGSARGWVRVDGKPFADTKKDIVAGKILHPLSVDERGVFVPRCNVWTGTSPEGTLLPAETCDDWKSKDANARTGTDAGVTGIFTSYSPAPCYSANRIYCFGINNNVQVTVNPVVGPIAFVTNGSWTPYGGLAEADGLCQQEATNASLSGNFIALLATAGQSAAKRFKASGLPWVRPDGVAIAPTAEALFSAHPLDTAINVTANGQYIADEGVWGGALAPDVAGTVETTCDNWTSPGKGSTGLSGGAAFTYQQDYFGKDLATCDISSKRLYCLQRVTEF